MRLRHNTALYVFLLLSAFISTDACRHEPESAPASLTVLLRWSPSHGGQTQEQVVTGIRWCLSFLGASLPASQDKQLFYWKTNSLLQVNLEKAGFSEEAKRVWQKLVTRFKESGEYTEKGGLEIGRFVMLTLNSSNHYYALTGTSNNYQSFRNRYSFEPKKAAVIESEVSKKHRIIEFPGDSSIAKTAYIAHEVDGSVISGTYSPVEFEVMDIMSNGQLRFGIYNTNGQQVPASDSTKSNAGKPAKCLWCHEVNILQPFTAVTSVPGFYSPEEFKNKVLGRKTVLENQRLLLTNSSLDYNKKQDHTQMELLYISFMEPSAERLSKEWGKTVNEVQQILSGLPTHIHSEFPFLGTLYDRNDVDPLSPYNYLRVPESAREVSAYEPNFIY